MKCVKDTTQLQRKEIQFTSKMPIKIKGKSIRIPIYLKGWKNGKLIVSTKRHKIPAVRLVIEANNCEKWYLKVTYGKGRTPEGIKIIYNDGDYDNKKDLLYALKCFTTKYEIEDYIKEFRDRI